VAYPLKKLESTWGSCYDL